MDSEEEEDKSIRCLSMEESKKAVDDLNYGWELQFTLHHKQDEVCCICLERFKLGEWIDMLCPCRHVVHQHCSEKNFDGSSKGKSCPYCRQQIDYSNFYKMRNKGDPYSEDEDDEHKPGPSENPENPLSPPPPPPVIPSSPPE